MGHSGPANAEESRGRDGCVRLEQAEDGGKQEYREEGSNSEEWVGARQHEAKAVWNRMERERTRA